MASTSVAVKASESEAKDRASSQKELSVGRGVFWIIVFAAGWNVVLVLFHNITEWLLR